MYSPCSNTSKFFTPVYLTYTNPVVILVSIVVQYTICTHPVVMLVDIVPQYT